MKGLRALSLSLLLSIQQLALAGGETFVIGVENLFYLPHYHFENGEFSGYSRAVLDAFAERHDYNFEYRAMPINELFQQLISKKIDFKYPDSPSWQHTAKQGVRIAYSDPVTPYIDGASVLPQKKSAGLRRLQRMGTLQGFTPLDYEYLIESGAVELLETTSTRKLIEMALNEKVDAIYANIDVIQYQLNLSGKEKGALVFDPLLPYTIQSYMLSTAKRPRMLKEFNIFLREEKELIKSLKLKYGIRDILDRTEY